MRPSGSRLLATKFVFIAVISASAIAGFAYFQGISVRPVGAVSDAAGVRRFSLAVDSVRPEMASVDDSPWLNLRSGKAIGSEYAGTEAAISLFESGSLRPSTLIAVDANFDGLADAISGFSSGNGGVITLHRAAREAFAPESPESLAGIKRGEFPSSFEREAAVIEVPISPDFIASGRFRSDSDLDVAVASRNSSDIYLIPLDGKGGFGTPVKFDAGGDVTAMAADTFDPTKAFAGIILGTHRDAGFRLMIADGTTGFDQTKMRSIELPQQVDSLVLANPDGSTLEKDLFILGGGQLSRVEGIGKSGSDPESIDLPVRVRDFAAGEFIRDRRAKAELAVLGENGVIYYFKNGPIDTRPFTESEVRENFAKNGRGRSRVVNSTDTDSALANNWSIAEEKDLGIINPARETVAPILVRSRVTGNETDDLIVIDPAANRVKVLFKEPNYEAGRSSFTGTTQEGDLGFAGGITAVLPMRLSVMGQQGIAVLESGKLEPTPIVFTPQATFIVSKTADTADGLCNADCSLREAIVAANTAAGADLIAFAPNGTHQLTIAGVNENGSANGDLDITQATTITGNGSLNTILQAGTTTSNGIDKVLSINPAFTSAFATSISGVTIRFGRNPSPFAGDGFGGGFDWEASGTGTLSVTNSEISSNSTLDGDGGGVVATNSNAGAGAVTINNTVITGNAPARTGGASPAGGGLFVGTTTPYFISLSGFSSNTVNGSGGQGQGGGIFAFGPGGTGGNSTMSGSSVTSNTAPSDAGGLYTTQRIDISPTANFVSNTSGRFGGAIFINHASSTSSVSKAVIRNNSATTTGSGIYLGSSTTANVLNVSFSRIVNNTGAGLKGLATAGGTANAENNWWGCSTTPTAAPCDTVGNTGLGTVDADPWLQLRLTASPSTINVGQTSALTASFLLNSAGSTISTSNLDTLIGINVSWGGTLGTISGSQNTIQANGTATATYNATTAGPGTATATVDNGTTTANITVNAPPSADLSITKTDGVTTVTAGGSTTYTITASNAGPSNATGATVADTFPASLTGTWTCVGAGGGTCTASGSGNINDTVNLPSGGSVTYTVSAAISASATGSLVNTATVAAPAGVTDPTPGNNSATDSDTISASADLSITKTDGVTSVTAGTSTTYTITASNAGPSNAPGSTVADTFPAAITGVTWTCVGAGGGTCTASGSGNINDTVSLPAGGSVIYTAVAAINVAATGSLVNTATVATAGGVSDPTPGNNSATDTDTIIPSDIIPPTATSTPAGVNTAGGTSYIFTVTYADNTAINVSTLDSNDVIVTGPLAFSAPATFVSVDTNTNGTPRIATYSIIPPGGSWDAADNGTYSVVMQASQVADTIGNFVASGTLGTFQVLPLTLTVDRTDDSAGANACTAAANDCSLRGAISRANVATTNDTINFDPVIFATPQTILLANTELVLNNSGTLNIIGPGADKVTIDGNNATRILVASPSLVATVSGIRLTKGNGVGTTNTGRGGAVYNTGANLTLNGVIITGNAAPNGGGFNTATNGTTTLVNSWIYNNSATGAGGGGQNFSGSTLNVINTSITNNTCASTSTGGGALQANGTVFITNSTIGGNTATGGSGGGIYFNGAALTVTNSTIAGNTSTNNGGGIHATTATAAIRNSIIAGNNGTAASVDATGTFVSNGNNIIGVVGLSGGWVGSDLQNTDPLLAPLGFYGGNGLTFALTSASPAVNAAQGCVLTLTCTGTNPAAAITLDQRGAGRVGVVDIGSLELNNSANGGSYVAVLPSGLQNSLYGFQLTANNGLFTQAITSGALPNAILLTTALAPAAATSLAGTPTVFGVFNFGITSTSGPNSNLTDYRLTVFAAAGSFVFLEGRITDTNGQPVRNAAVVLTDTGVLKRATLTSPLGYYRFENVPAGPGYSVGVSSKRYSFISVNFNANLNITGLDLVGTPLP